VFATEVVYDQDVAIFNAYPKDAEIMQFTCALNIASMVENDIVKKDCYVVITTACRKDAAFTASAAMELA
jgi:hypothetical protein